MSTSKATSSSPSSVMHVDFTLGDGDRMTDFVTYSNAHSHLKWKKMCVRSYEIEIMKRLRESRIPQTKKVTLARAMTYYPAYPGTSRRAIAKSSFETRLEDYERDVESNFKLKSAHLFNDLPPESKFKFEQLAASPVFDEASRGRISQVNSKRSSSSTDFRMPERVRFVGTTAEMRNLSPSFSKLKLYDSSSSENGSIALL